MNPTTRADPKDAPAADGGTPRGSSSLLEGVASLWQELRELAHEQLTLVALETRLAGKSLVIIVAAGVIAGVLLVSAWLGLMGALVLWLIGMGMASSIALLLAIAANLMLALILYALVRRQSRHLQFPATLRSLRPVPSKLHGSRES